MKSKIQWYIGYHTLIVNLVPLENLPESMFEHNPEFFFYPSGS